MEREIEQRLNEQDIRYTRGRRAVVAALTGIEGPRSAAEIHLQIGDRVPLSSLYRSLTTLEEAGVLVPHYGTKGVTRYELADWLQGHHHHLVCIDCGAVDDVDIEAPVEKRLAQLIDEIGHKASFSPVDHVLEIEGRCTRCAS